KRTTQETPRQPGFRRAEVNAPANAPSTPPTPPAQSAAADDATDPNAAADGLLINGSVHNGAASPFAQLPAFGNNRPGRRSLHNGGIALPGGTSASGSRSVSVSTVVAHK